MIALIDCNNFYCSCERLFRPDLWRKAIVVLSNNDGCVISRSNEAKALGIKMGEPFFKIKDLVSTHQVHVFSSNFPLYADLSNRVMSTLKEFSPNIEFYSIDEAFVELSGSKEEIEATCRQIRDTLYTHIGIPVSIGCAPTKVLAKAAGHFAKRLPELRNVAVWTAPKQWNAFLHYLNVEDIWGLGYKLSKKCQAKRLYTAYDFAHYKNTKWIQKEFTKLGRFIQEELQGSPCLTLETVKEKRKQIRVSRSFKTELTSKEDLQHALCSFATRALEKCRAQQSQVQVLSIFFRSNPFKNQERQSGGYHIALPYPSDNTLEVLKSINHVLKHHVNTIFPIKKAGVTLQELHDSDREQLSFLYEPSQPKEKALMSSIDSINKLFGSQTCLPASCINKKGVKGVRGLQNRQFQSPRYTTDLSQLVTVT